MIAVSASQMRSIEQNIIQNHQIPSMTLMRTAGTALADVAETLFSWDKTFSVAVFAGKGNNGGDGLIAAQVLHQRNRRKVKIYLTVSPDSLSGDALNAWNELDPEIPWTTEMPCADDLKNAMILDCLLGTGFHGSPQEPVRSWIVLANSLNCPVVSADLPSGMNPDTGIVEDISVRADFTVSFGALKKGLLLGDAPAFCGKLLVCDLGIPHSCFAGLPDTVEYTSAEEIAPLIRPLDADTHKFKRGHAVIAGGSADYPSAPLLTAEAAMRSGAGIATLFLPDSAPVYCVPPRALILRRAETTRPGYFTASSADWIFRTKPSVLVVGMGIGLAPETSFFLEQILQKAACPVLLDADALTLIARNPDLQNILCRPERSFPVVITPHEGEMARLETAFGLDASLSRMDRAKKMAQKLNGIVVLKGPRTVVSAPDGRCSLNLSGSPCLATAGSGDILAGMIAGQICALKAHLFDACRTGVCLHGKIGEPELGQLPCSGLIADDFLPRIPQAFLKTVNRVLRNIHD